MTNDNRCPFCMREMPTETDEGTDKDGYDTLIRAIGQITLALGAAKTLITSMKDNHDEGEPR